jgi:glutamine amidotransferase
MNLILNCGTGNFSSVAKMINATGGKSFFGSTPKDIDNASKIILPGVGSFDNGMKAIELASIKEKIIERVKFENIPILGICLGMHLLCRSSEEGSLGGLGLVDAEVKKFYFPNNENMKIPHMGWNTVKSISRNPLIPKLEREQRYYFAHSYKVVLDNPNLAIGTTHYGSNFCAAFKKKNIFGVQFHPEKSHSFGLELIRCFVEL